MILNFINQHPEVDFMKLADLEVLDQHFYVGDNVDQQKNNNLNKPVKERKRYSPTKVKAQNFLTNISYKRLTKKRFYQ